MRPLPMFLPIGTHIYFTVNFMENLLLRQTFLLSSWNSFVPFPKTLGNLAYRFNISSL